MPGQGNDFVLSQAERDAIEHEKHHYEDPRAASIEALKIVQQARGWVPDGAIHAIAAELGIPASDVEGRHLLQPDLPPAGRSPHHPRLRQHGVLHQRPRTTAGRPERGDGPSTRPDLRRRYFTLLPVCCLGNCDKGPALMIDDDTYGGLDAVSLLKTLEAYP